MSRFGTRALSYFGFHLFAAGAAAAEKVAEDIYAAAADGTDRLRYCAPYGVEQLVKAKRELDDKEYENFVRSVFPGK